MGVEGEFVIVYRLLQEQQPSALTLLLPLLLNLLLTRIFLHQCG
jgi:hypothetical protein